MNKNTVELAKMAFAGTSDEALIDHYNSIIQELAFAVKVLDTTGIEPDEKIQHMMLVFREQAIGCEYELIRRGLARPEELTFAPKENDHAES